MIVFCFRIRRLYIHIQGANRNTATNQTHIGALNSTTYETVLGSGGDFGMTMIDLVPGQCMERTNIKKLFRRKLGSAYIAQLTTKPET